jgi:hypothetical protein
VYGIPSTVQLISQGFRGYITLNRKMRLALALFPLALSASLPAYAEVSVAQLYEDCTATHVPPSSRTSAEWVKVRRCENVVVSTVRALPWPLQVPSTTKWPGGETTNDVLICPVDPQWYDEPKLVDFYLKYWDRKGVGLVSGRIQSGSASVAEAFTEQFHDCAKAARK